MAQQSKQQAAIAQAQALASIMLQLSNLQDAVVSYNSTYANNLYATYWSAMTTAPWLADGTISGTPDGTPNIAHPIIEPTGAPLLMPELSLAQALTTLTNFAAFMGGTAVGSQNPTPRSIADALNK